MSYDSQGGWQQQRLDLIKAHYAVSHEVGRPADNSYFKDKTVLEVGAAWGFFGNALTQLGALVVCSDYSKANLDVINKRYGLQVVLHDLNTKWPFHRYDVVVHMGVFYHQPIVRASYALRKACRSCHELIFETAIDSGVRSEPAPQVSELWESDVVPSSRCVPSIEFIESILAKEQMTFTRKDYTSNRALWIASHEVGTPRESDCNLI